MPLCFLLSKMNRYYLFQLELLLSNRMSKREVDDAIEFLQGEGHIDSTNDDDHFTFRDLELWAKIKVLESKVERLEAEAKRRERKFTN